MKRKISGKISASLIFFIFFGTSLMIAGGIGEVDAINKKMMSLGFLENKLEKQRDGSYSIKVNAYAQRSQALSLDGVFRPFEVHAKYSQRILYLEKTDIEKAGFSIAEEYLPRGIKIVRMGVAILSKQKRKPTFEPYIQRIKQALEDTKRNRKRVFANCMEVVHKANQTFSLVFPDVCKTPSPAGPIPIPYPNIAKSSDTTKGSKKVKADAAEALVKDSNFKISESDEAGTRMKKLQRSYNKITAKRELSVKEKAAYKKELKTCLDKSRLLMKTLDKYVEEIEKLLQQAKKQ